MCNLLCGFYLLIGLIGKEEACVEQLLCQGLCQAPHILLNRHQIAVLCFTVTKPAQSQKESKWQSWLTCTSGYTVTVSNLAQPFQLRKGDDQLHLKY